MPSVRWPIRDARLVGVPPTRPHTRRHAAGAPRGARGGAGPARPARIARRCIQSQDHGLAQALDYKLIELAGEALTNQSPIEIKLPIRNVHRTVGAMLSGEIARRYGSAGLPDDTIRFEFTGSAGQSFGAFLAK